MKTFKTNHIFSFIFFLCSSSMIFAQDKPTIYVDIPSEQKPWNHINWNNSDEKFQFAVVTDRTGGARPGVFADGLKKINLLQPDFTMSVGDLIFGYTEDVEQINREWAEIRSYVDVLDAPFFYVPGNHDITNAVMEKKWNELFGVTYYHFIYKDVLILCLNSEDGFGGAGQGAIGDEQYNYIKKTLEENADVKWTLVFLHQPLWIQNQTNRWKEVEKLLGSRKHNVFAGHYHRYWKTERNNGKYIALATTGGGSPLRGKAYGEFDHVAWVTMTPDGPIIANLFLDGIWDENVTTEALVELVRNKPFPVQIEPLYLDDRAQKNAHSSIKITNDSDIRMRVKLKGYAHDGLFYQLEETSILVEPNDVAVPKITFKNIGEVDINETTPIRIEADITYEFKDERPNVNFSSVLNYKPFYKKRISQASKIKLDGKLEDWKDMTWNTLDEMRGSPFNFGGITDCSIKFATTYDQSNLYIAIDLTDNDIVVLEEESHWKQDLMVLTLDSRPMPISAYGGTDGQGQNWLAYYRTFKTTTPVHQENKLPTKVTTEIERTKTGATWEMAIPLEYLKGNSEGDWSSFRIGLEYHDHDIDDKGSTYHYWYPAWGSASNITGSGMFFRK